MRRGRPLGGVAGGGGGGGSPGSSRASPPVVGGTDYTPAAWATVRAGTVAHSSGTSGTTARKGNEPQPGC
eukprot:14034666-Alexandrium_andersonii.AAC.1